MRAEAGSYVYDALVMHFYQAIPPDTTRQDLKLLQREWKADRTELEEEHRPTRVERQAVALGLRWYTECMRRFGTEERPAYPRIGGYMDQPLRWLRGIETVMAARDEARREQRFEDAEDKAARRNQG